MRWYSARLPRAVSSNVRLRRKFTVLTLSWNASGPGFRISDFESNRIIGEAQFKGAQTIMNGNLSPVSGAVRSVHVNVNMSVPCISTFTYLTSFWLGQIIRSHFRTVQWLRPALLLWVSVKKSILLFSSFMGMFNFIQASHSRAVLRKFSSAGMSLVQFCTNCFSTQGWSRSLRFHSG